MKNTIVISTVLIFVLTAFNLPQSNRNGSSESSASKTVFAGIKFGKKTMKKALAEAKSSGKLVFLDVYTTWCGPCKEMARTTFKSDEVGDLFNKNFINLKLDAENDKDGPEVTKAYGISGYPTLLFINGEGKMVKKLVGKQSEEKLIAIANTLLQK